MPGKSRKPNQGRWRPRHFSVQVGRKGLMLSQRFQTTQKTSFTAYKTHTLN